MADIVLCTLNARWSHASFGLRYLLANLGALQERCVLVEAEIAQRSSDTLEQILVHKPQIVGLGVYVWNALEMHQLAQLLKAVRPEIRLVLGGPEISYETAAQPIAALADHIITGEADLAFAQLCRQLLEGLTPPRLIVGGNPSLDSIQLPYDLYDDNDLANRIVYVEASRGCPFECEFCLSSLDAPVRSFDTSAFLKAMEKLWERGLRRFKFVDRTFNLDIKAAVAILDFFRKRQNPQMFLHFEMIPDRLPPQLEHMLEHFAPGTIQLELGVQTFHPQAAQLIHRRQNAEQLQENLRRLATLPAVHVHADLIAGLPAEDEQSFGQGFDRLWALGVQEIQLGILKRLRGAPISRHTQAWQMVYSPLPPYELMQNKLIDFAGMQRLKRLARYWDLLGNSGHFSLTLPLLFAGRSPYGTMREFTGWMESRHHRSHGIALQWLFEMVYEFYAAAGRIDLPAIQSALAADWRNGGRRAHPTLGDAAGAPALTHARSALPPRQRRRLRDANTDQPPSPLS